MDTDGHTKSLSSCAPPQRGGTRQDTPKTTNTSTTLGTTNRRQRTRAQRAHHAPRTGAQPEDTGRGSHSRPASIASKPPPKRGQAPVGRRARSPPKSVTFEVIRGAPSPRCGGWICGWIVGGFVRGLVALGVLRHPALYTLGVLRHPALPEHFTIMYHSYPVSFHVNLKSISNLPQIHLTSTSIQHKNIITFNINSSKPHFTKNRKSSRSVVMYRLIFSRFLNMFMSIISLHDCNHL